VKKTVLCTAILAIFSISAPAFADQVSDLKAEIAAQKQAAEAQKLRLDALEQKLNAVQTQQQAVVAASPAAAAPGALPEGVSFERGKGLSYATPQGSVSLYGLIDLTYVHTDNADKQGNSVTAPRVAWFSGNRWGLTGRRAMGDSGLDTIFKLESEFESQTGDMDTPGVLFNRDAWVGLESDSLGKLTLGRQNAIARDPISSGIYGDPYGPAAPTLEEGGYTNNNNFKQLIFYAGSATGTRLDNGVVWKKQFANNVYAGAAYQFGGVPGSFSQGSTETLTLAYAGGAYNLAGFATQANVDGRTNRSYSVGGNYTIGPVRLNAGAFHYTAEQGLLGSRTDNAYTVSAKFSPKGKLDYQLGYQNMKADNAAVNLGGNVLNAFSSTSLSTATATGSRGTFYASTFYHFDKITEVYLATDYLKLRDGYKFAATHGFGSQWELGVGLRTRF
jgi:predicted porin